jgi:hypothetical protein
LPPDAIADAAILRHAADKRLPLSRYAGLMPSFFALHFADAAAEDAFHGCAEDFHFQADYRRWPRLPPLLMTSSCHDCFLLIAPLRFSYADVFAGH